MKKQYAMSIKNTPAPFKKTILFSALAAVLIPIPAFAQDEHAPAAPTMAAPVDILPVKMLTGDGEIPEKEETTHPTVHLTPDKSELIRLDRDAGTIVVGNPAHVNILADSSRTLVIIPRMPGATHFTVLDGQGDIIMQRHVIVASPKENYVRIRRTCTDDAEGCQNTSVFYCPDMCHEIMIGSEDDSSGGSSGKSGGSSSGGDTGSMGDLMDEEGSE